MTAKKKGITRDSFWFTLKVVKTIYFSVAFFVFCTLHVCFYCFTIIFVVNDQYDDQGFESEEKPIDHDNGNGLFRFFYT